jgi:hypothetical protein
VLFCRQIEHPPQVSHSCCLFRMLEKIISGLCLFAIVSDSISTEFFFGNVSYVLWVRQPDFLCFPVTDVRTAALFVFNFYPADVENRVSS